MASDGELTCTSDPNFAVICSFLERFASSCGITHPNISELQEMLENSQEVPQPLVELHVKLLRKARKYVSGERWERALIKFCHTYSNQDGWELERFGYKKARLGVKIRILKTLLEQQFDLNSKFKAEINKLSACELRNRPLGRDKLGQTYWCQLDDACNLRVYREDLDDETWEIVASDREGLVQLISKLSSNDPFHNGSDTLINDDSNSMGPEKPITDTGQHSKSPVVQDKLEEGRSEEFKGHSDDHSSDKIKVESNKGDNSTILDTMNLQPPTQEKSDDSLQTSNELTNKTESTADTPITNTIETANKDPVKCHLNEVNNLSTIICDREIDFGEKCKSSSGNVEDSKISGNGVESSNIVATELNQPVPQNDLVSVNYNVDVKDEEHVRCAEANSCSIPKLVENKSLTTSIKGAEENDKCINQNSNPLLKTTIMPDDTDVIPAKRSRAMDDSIAVSPHDSVESEVGEPIEEPLMLVYGEGSGKDCDTGNPIKNSDDDAGSSQDKNENNLTTNVSLERNKESEIPSKTENGSTNTGRPEDETSTAKQLDSGISTGLFDIVKSVAKQDESSNKIITEPDKSSNLNLEAKTTVLTESVCIKDKIELVKVSETANKLYQLPNSEIALGDTSSFEKHSIHPTDVCESLTNYDKGSKNFQMTQKPIEGTLHGSKTDLTYSNFCEKEIVSTERGGDQSETSPKLWSIDAICKSNNPPVGILSSTEAKISSKVMGMDSGTEINAMCLSNKPGQCVPLDCDKTASKLSVEIEQVVKPEEKYSTEESSIGKIEGTVQLPGTKCVNKTDVHQDCDVLPSESNCDYVPGVCELNDQAKNTPDNNLPFSKKNEKDDARVSSICIPPSGIIQDTLMLKQQDPKLSGTVSRESISLHADPISDIKSGQNKDSTEVQSSKLELTPNILKCDSTGFMKEAEELNLKPIIYPTSVVKEKLDGSVSLPNAKIDRNNKSGVEFAKPFMVEKCNFSDKSPPLAPGKCFSENPLGTFSAQGSSKHKDVLSQKLQSMQSSGKNRRKSVESITMGIMNKLAAKSCLELQKTAQIRSIDDVIGSNSKVSNKPVHKPVPFKSADIEFPESKDFQSPSKDKYLDLTGNKTNDKNQMISASIKPTSSAFIPENLPQSILPATESMLDPLRQLTDFSHLTPSPSFLSSSLLKKFDVSRKDMESGVEYLRKTLDIKDTPGMVLDLHKTGKKSVDKYFDSQLKMPELTKPLLDKSFNAIGLDKLKAKESLDPTNLFKEPDLNKIAEIALLKGFVPEPLVMKEKAWLCGSSVPLINKPEIQSNYSLPFNIGNKTQFHDDKLRMLSGSCTTMREKPEKRVGEDTKVRDNRHVKRTETRKELGLESVINKSLAYFTAVKDMSSIHREHESSNYGMPSSISTRGAPSVMKAKDCRLESSLEPQDLTVSSKHNSSLGSKCDTLGKIKDTTVMQGQSISQPDAKSFLKGLTLKNINIEPVKDDKPIKDLQNLNVSNIHNQNTSPKFNTLGSSQSVSIHNYETSSNSVFHSLPTKDNILNTPLDMKVTQTSEIAKEKVHYGLKVKPLEKLSEVKLSEIKIDALKEYVPDKPNLPVTLETSINLKMPGKDKVKELSVCPIKSDTEKEHYQSGKDEPLDKLNDSTQPLKKTESDGKPTICKKSTADCVPQEVIKDASSLKEAHSTKKLQEHPIEAKSKYNTSKNLTGRNEEFSIQKVSTEIKLPTSSISNSECVINDIANSSVEEVTNIVPNVSDKNLNDSNPTEDSKSESLTEKTEVVNSLSGEPALRQIVENSKASQEKSKVLTSEESTSQELKHTFEGHDAKVKVDTSILNTETEMPKVVNTAPILTKEIKSPQCSNDSLEQTLTSKDNNCSEAEDKKSISKPLKQSPAISEAAEDMSRKKKTFELFTEKELIKSEINIVLEKCDRMTKNDKKRDSKENMDSVRNETSLCIKKNEDSVLETDPLEGLGDSLLCSDTSGSQRRTRSGRLKFAATMPVVTKTSSKSKKSAANSSSKNTEEDSVKTRNSKNKLEMKVDSGSVETNKKRTNLRSRKNSSVEIVKLDVETDVALSDYLQTNDENGKTEKGGGARTMGSDPLLSEETADLTEEIKEAALDSIKSSKRGKNKKHDSDAVLEIKLADNSEVKGTGTTCNNKRGSKKASGKQVRPKIETLELESSFSEDSGCQSEIQVKTESEISLVDTNSQSKEGESTNRGRGRSHKRGIGTLSSRSRGRGRGRTVTAGSRNATESPAPSSDPPSDSTTPVKKTRKRSVDLVIEESKEEMSENPEPRMRQSRRIAQIKIREEAERRKIEELTLMQIKEEQKMHKHSKKTESQTPQSDKKKRKQKLSESDEDYTAEDWGESGKKKSKGIKKKRKKKGSKFNKNTPWQSSSESSSSEEEEEEEPEQSEEEEEEADLIFKSDHEFSPESDLEEGADESLPMRRARTAKKGADEEEKVDEHACQKCGKSDHPEWILLCDKCDSGWHGSCLRPALLVIPEGDWFCPPCEHLSLLTNLENNLIEFDRIFKRRENEELRRKRIAYVGISLDNVLSAKVEKDGFSVKELERSTSSSSTSSTSESSSGDESEPVYQLRQRRSTVLSYRYNDYDELIYSAIQDEMEAVKGAGNQGRGKDIETIVKAGKEEEDTKFEDLGKDSSELSQSVKKEENSQVEKEDEDDEEEEEGYIPPVRKFQHAKKKHRKLNSLDFSSEDDADSDEDFKGSSSDEEEDDDVDGDYTDESDVGGRRRHGKRHSSKPVRRSSRARTTRFDKEFINDDSEDSDAPRRKKSRRVWHESDSEESDWGKKKRKKSFTFKPKGQKKKRRESRDLDLESFRRSKPKKPKIVFGGLDDDDDDKSLQRRTRGRKINYQEMAGSDTEEEVIKRSQKVESEDEFVVSDEEKDEDDIDEREPVLSDDKENESDNDFKRNELTSPVKKKIGLVRKKKQIIRDDTDDEGDEFEVQAPQFEKDDKGESSLIQRAQPKSEKSTVPAAVDSYVETSFDAVSGETGVQEGTGSAIERRSVLEKRELQDTTEVVSGDLQDSEPNLPESSGIASSQVEHASNVSENEATVAVDAVPKAGVQALKGMLESQPLRGMLGMNQTFRGFMDSQQQVITATSPQPANNSQSQFQRTEMTQEKNSVNVIPKVADDPQGTSPLKLAERDQQQLVNPRMGMEAQSPPKRKGRGRGKANSSNAGASNAEIGEARYSMQTQHYSPQNLVSSSTSSVITRMLQAQPVSQQAPQSFTAAATAMGHKYFGTGQDQHYPSVSPTKPGRIPSPYRQVQTPINNNPASISQHYPVRPGQVRPSPPGNSAAVTLRMRVPGPQSSGASQPPSLYHSSHHPLDPSPSGGGQVVVGPRPLEAGQQPSSVVPVASGSPLGAKPSVSHSTPPPPYPRPRFPPDVPAQQSPVSQSPVRHAPPFQSNHLHTQSPPPHQQGRSPSNFSSYHPPPPTYHFGSYPPPPPVAAAEDALPPSAYQGSPYPDHYAGSEPPHNLQASDGSNSRTYEEEGGGEFGGLVSYFSSQREDDLDT